MSYLCLGSSSTLQFYGAGAPGLIPSPNLSARPSVFNPGLCLAPPLALATQSLLSLCRAHLGQNESAWGRLWLEVPDSAAPDSVVMVTVTAVGQGAHAVPPTHAFLRLLVLARSSQVRRFHLRSFLAKLGTLPFLLFSAGSAGDPCPLCRPRAPSSHPSLASFHFGDSGQSWGRGGRQSLVGNSWRGAVPARLLFLVARQPHRDRTVLSTILSPPHRWDGHMLWGPGPPNWIFLLSHLSLTPHPPRGPGFSV